MRLLLIALPPMSVHRQQRAPTVSNGRVGRRLDQHSNEPHSVLHDSPQRVTPRGGAPRVAAAVWLGTVLGGTSRDNDSRCPLLIGAQLLDPIRVRLNENRDCGPGTLMGSTDRRGLRSSPSGLGAQGSVSQIVRRTRCLF